MDKDIRDCWDSEVNRKIKPSGGSGNKIRKPPPKPRLRRVEQEPFAFLKPSKRQEKNLNVRVAPEEKNVIKQEAKDRGLSISDLIREALHQYLIEEDECE